MGLRVLRKTTLHLTIPQPEVPQRENYVEGALCSKKVFLGGVRLLARDRMSVVSGQDENEGHE